MEIIDLSKISIYSLLANPNKYLSKDKEYLIICEHGIGSSKASKILNNMGYHTKSSKLKTKKNF